MADVTYYCSTCNRMFKDWRIAEKHWTTPIKEGSYNGKVSYTADHHIIWQATKMLDENHDRLYTLVKLQRKAVEGRNSDGSFVREPHPYSSSLVDALFETNVIRPASNEQSDAVARFVKAHNIDVVVESGE